MDEYVSDGRIDRFVRVPPGMVNKEKAQYLFTNVYFSPLTERTDRK